MQHWLVMLAMSWSFQRSLRCWLCHRDTGNRLFVRILMVVKLPISLIHYRPRSALPPLTFVMSDICALAGEPETRMAVSARKLNSLAVPSVSLSLICYFSASDTFFPMNTRSFLDNVLQSGSSKTQEDFEPWLAINSIVRRRKGRCGLLVLCFHPVIRLFSVTTYVMTLHNLH